MTIAHPIADMLTRIRNANEKFHPDVSMPHSKVKETISCILEAEGFIAGYEVIARKPQSTLRLRLKYRGERSTAQRAITGIRLVSKPSRRVYASKEEIPKPVGGLGACIVSTSQGILSGREARERGIGGEVLCEVW